MKKSKHISCATVNERLRLSKKVYAYAKEHSVSWNKASDELGISRHVFHNTVNDWRLGRVTSSSKNAAKQIIGMAIECNRLFSKNKRSLKSWDDVEVGKGVAIWKRRLQEAKKLHALSMKEGICLSRAAQKLGYSQSEFGKVISLWIEGRIGANVTHLAEQVLDLVLEVNRLHGINSQYKTWGDIKRAIKQRRPSAGSDVEKEALPLFQSKPADANARLNSQSLFLVQKLTGKTEQEITEEAIAMYCKAILQDYVSTL